MASQHKRGMVKFIIPAIVVVLLSFLIPVFLNIRQTMHYRERAEYAKAKLESMKSRCPEEVVAGQVGSSHRLDIQRDFADLFFSDSR